MSKLKRPGPFGFRQNDIFYFTLFVAMATRFLHGMQFFEQLCAVVKVIVDRRRRTVNDHNSSSGKVSEEVAVTEVRGIYLININQII